MMIETPIITHDEINYMLQTLKQGEVLNPTLVVWKQVETQYRVLKTLTTQLALVTSHFNCIKLCMSVSQSIELVQLLT